MKSLGLGSLTHEDLQRVVWRRPHEPRGLTSSRFWRFGSWVDVVIDDKLPTIDGRLVFVRSKRPTEFWPALLEKAYAKVKSYADMDAGNISEAIMDFTGGPHMTIKLSEASDKLWDAMRRASQSESLMGCGTPGGQAGLLQNKVLPNGLVEMHAYTVTGVAEVRVNFLAGSYSSAWKTEVHKGQWVIGTTAGGCSNDLESFSKNPQFRVTLKQTVEDPRDESSPNLLVSLIQKSHKRNRHLATNLHIGFKIYEVPAHLKDRKEKFPASFFKTNPVGKTKSYNNAQEIMEFFRFKAGDYVIVPSTFKPNEASSFLLTVYSKPSLNSSGYGMIRTKLIPRDNDDSFQLFLQYADKYGEVDAEQLQRLLNENLYEGHSQKTKGFSLDLCKSMVALMDYSSVSLEGSGLRLWKRAVFLKNIFYDMDVSHTGSLSLNELQNALKFTEFILSDSMLNLMALRYGDSSGEITLENFVVLVLRMDCMASESETIACCVLVGHLLDMLLLVSERSGNIQM
ncbi:calpain-1 catalytic subunit-like [Chanodichthys erythropterus]|uniref:calpain-1 catalytic subunit-like n=1 Tax=Chanodichthys erythropterus TaxID=933992 RepID=UPI00351EA8F7